MAIDPRKRQRKLERRNARHKAQKKVLACQKSAGLSTHLEAIADKPFLLCCVSDTVWDQGLGYVLVSRMLEGGNVAYVTFLLDVYCLGVKNLDCGIAPRHRYQDLVNRFNRRFHLEEFTPECARKLVEGAVAFARGFGLSPHPDYATGKLIFGDVDAGACEREFEYGKDGKPFFVAGPNDGPARCQQIMRLLAEHTGPGGHDFLVPISPDVEITELELVNNEA